MKPKNQICKCGHEEDFHKTAYLGCAYRRCTCKKFEPQCNNIVEETGSRCGYSIDEDNPIKAYCYKCRGKPKNHSPQSVQVGVKEKPAGTLSNKRFIELGVPKIGKYYEKDIKDFIQKLQDELCICSTALPEDKCLFCGTISKFAGDDLI